MKIGVMLENFHLPFDKAAEAAAEKNVSGVQFYLRGARDVDGMTDEKLEEMLRVLKKNNLEISAFCGDLGGHGFMEALQNPDKIRKSKLMADIAVKAGVKIITTHIGTVPEDKSNPVYTVMRDALKEIGAYAHERGVIFAIETGPEKAVVLRDFIEGLNGIGVNLDPANLAMCVGDKAAEAVRTLAPYIVHTHAKDGRRLKPLERGAKQTPAQYVFNPIYREAPLGRGDIDWDSYIQALKDIGYDGYLTIERETLFNKSAAIQQAIDFLREKLNIKPYITLAVIGCGNIARAAHLPSIAKIKEYKLKYCVDIIKERADWAAEKYGTAGFTKALTDYKEILNDPELDAAIICTHTCMHSVMAIDFLKAGKNVLSEKPVATSYDKALAMAAAAKESGKILNIGVCMRYNKVVAVVKDLIDSGKLGDIYSVYCSFRKYRMIPGIGGEFTTKERAGGGVLFDWGVHFFDLILYAIGGPDILSATADTHSIIGKDIEGYKHQLPNLPFLLLSKKYPDGTYDVEEFVSGYVRTTGAGISLNGAWAQNIKKNEMFVDFMGSKGGIRMLYNKSLKLYTVEKGGRLNRSKPKAKGYNHYFAEHLAFVKDIMSGSRSRAYIDNILPTSLMLEWLYRSAEEKKEKSL